MSVRKRERIERIQEYLQCTTRATISELRELLKASEATIRRDLDELANIGAVNRIRGGAVLLNTMNAQPLVIQRGFTRAEEKRRIGRRAAELINDGETVFIGSGSTALEVAKNLIGHKNLTVITNSLPVINVLINVPGIKIVVTGGFLRNSELSLIGHLVEKSLSELRADKTIIGMQGIHTLHGLTNDFLPEAMTDRTIANFAPELIVVVDSSKFGKISTSFVADLNLVSTIVTDYKISSEILSELQAYGLRVIIAEQNHDGSRTVSKDRTI